MVVVDDRRPPRPRPRPLPPPAILDEARGVESLGRRGRDIPGRRVDDQDYQRAVVRRREARAPPTTTGGVVVVVEQTEYQCVAEAADPPGRRIEAFNGGGGGGGRPSIIEDVEHTPIDRGTTRVARRR